jgi:dUTP pyrophosphatase
MSWIRVHQHPEAEGLPLPSYGSAGAAGMDLYAAVPVDSDIVLKPGERKLIPIGISVSFPQGYSLDIQPRSGLALKYGITVLNSPGLVDEDYRGKIGVILFNTGTEDFVVRRGDRAAQAVLRPYLRAEIYSSTLDELGNTERGSDGYGSTGR